MNLKENLTQIVNIYEASKDVISTEEATKNALVMPMLQALGYNVFNPMEVIPEYISDIGTKKGEKVDYALIENGEPIILVECKHWKENLDNHVSQIYRYFGASKVKFGILTNGIEYRVYSDLDNKNVMDKMPFLTFTILADDVELLAIQSLHKSVFNSVEMVEKAKILKNNSVIANAVSNEFNDPSDALVKLLIRSGFGSTKRVTDKVIHEFRPLVRQAINTLITTKVTFKLNNALKGNEEIVEDEVELSTSGIVTTEEELEGLQIVKAMVRKVIPLDRVIAKDTKSYFGVLVDNNVRKPICRLHFNTSNKAISVFDENRSEVKHSIDGLNDLYNFESTLLNTAKSYL